MGDLDAAKEALLKRRRNRHKGSLTDPLERNKDGTDDDSFPPQTIFTEKQLTLKQVLVFLTAYLGVGAVCFFLVGNQIKGKKTNGILDAVYFCVVTMTTVGYGDLVPDTVLAKLLACVFVFTGMVLVGFVLSKAADYIVEKEEVLLVKALHNMHERFGANEMIKESETDRVKYKFLTNLTVLLVLIVIGNLFLCLIEKLSFFDAFYCVCATITTLGYGDTSFSTELGRLFAIFWILMSTISLAQLFLYTAELYTENRRRQLVDWVLNRKLTVSDLEQADLDNDKVVSLAEYIVYKLKEMGKVNDEDVALLIEGFKNLDVDHSGTLTLNDLRLSQSSQPQS